jgi:hypothetical protein
MKDVPFMNITINPVEASVICPKDLTEKFFRPLLSTYAELGSSESGMTIAPDDYLLMFVTGDSSQPSQRVIDLTTPLALAGISIFFITTYFSDYIICPQRSRNVVVAALEARGFELTHDCDPMIQSTTVNYSHRPPTASSDGSGSQILAPGTPPPSTLSELQIRTFTTLRKRAVFPTVHRDISLLSCAGKEGPLVDEQSLLFAIIRCILGRPRFFSLTVADGESPSLLLEKGCLPMFSSTTPNNATGAPQSLLLGTTSDPQIPIVLDLRNLPLESTGIVCGIAGKLVDSTKNQIVGTVEMSYLSTARAGAVIVSEEDVDRAIQVLEKAAKEEGL